MERPENRLEKALQAEEESVESSGTDVSGLQLSRYANWIFRSFLRDDSEHPTILGLEFESKLGLKKPQIKNISYIQVAQYDRGVPGQPAPSRCRSVRSRAMEPSAASKSAPGRAPLEVAWNNAVGNGKGSTEATSFFS